MFGMLVFSFYFLIVIGAWVAIDGYRSNMDMTMLTLFNSRERDEEDWRVIFKEADERFGNIKVWVPEGAILGAIEATWKG